jgi:2-aminoadipate transaminase
VVTAGSNQLLYLVSRVLCVPGDIVLCAAPTYFVYLGMLENLGIRAVGIETDAAGLIPDALDAQLRRQQQSGELGRVKALYLNSYFDNPRGVTIPANRRAELLELMRRWSSRAGRRLYVLEDAAYRELRYDGQDVPSIHALDRAETSGDDALVVYAGTFSKSFSPGIRLGWGILPRPLITPVLSAKGHLDFGTAQFNQLVMTEVLSSGGFARHVPRLREAYRRKRDALAAALDEHLAAVPGAAWSRPDGGLYLWLTLPPELPAGEAGPLLDRAIAEGILYVPGEHCYPPSGAATAPNTIRLSFGVEDADTLKRGAALLARAIRAAAESPSPEKAQPATAPAR